MHDMYLLGVRYPGNVPMSRLYRVGARPDGDGCHFLGMWGRRIQSTLQTNRGKRCCHVSRVWASCYVNSHPSRQGFSAEKTEVFVCIAIPGKGVVQGMFKKRTVGLFMLLFALLPPELILAASCTWVQVDVEGPPARHSPAMAYDSRREVVVLFGGFTGRERDANMYGDTWEWDGTTWTLLAPSGAHARARHGMVFEPKLGTLISHGVAFAGRPETLVWTGDEWEPLFVSMATEPQNTSRRGSARESVRQPARESAERTSSRRLGPAPRIYYGMVYDAAREAIVLFGGWDGSAPLGDTWVLRCE